jgi:SNF2 family DNA or RNA helicase
MVTVGTIEERKHRLLAFKRRVGSSILDNVGQDEMGRVENDLDTLTSYLEAVLDT